MNLKHMKELRDFIAKLPPAACDMNTWIFVDGEQVPKKRAHACGTTACLGGWTELMANPNCNFNETDEDGCGRNQDAPAIKANEYLDLSADEEQTLFYEYPHGEPRSWKTWMLGRLDGIIRDKAILPYDEQKKGTAAKPANLGGPYGERK
jgi:hypothetical protein